MRELPHSVSPEEIYNTARIAEILNMSVARRRQWYKHLETCKEGVVTMGDHFVLTGSQAMKTMLDSL